MNDKTRFFEELSLNAHCAMKVQFYDGWILRANEGHTKRANSVSPLYDSALETDTKIRSCEEFYKKAGLPCIFKLTDDDTELDEMLKGRGYDIVDPTDVMTLDISKRICAGSNDGYISFDKPEKEWLDAYCAYENSIDKQELIKKMFSLVTVDTIYAAVKKDGKIVSCASAAIERGHALIQNVVTDPSARRMGYGEMVCSFLMNEAAQKGVHTAYLQVVQSNTAAVKLYEKLGYKKIYTYHYMIKK